VRQQARQRRVRKQTGEVVHFRGVKYRKVSKLEKKKKESRLREDNKAKKEP
jgi:hypothetical protein